jgi:adenylylsulfate kinase
MEMAPDLAVFLVTAIVALTDKVPRVGEQFILSTSEGHIRGRLTSVALLLPGAISAPERTPQPHWSQLVSLEIEISGLAFAGPLCEGRTVRVDLQEFATGKPIAAGLTVDCRPGYADRPNHSPALPGGGLTIWLTGLSGAGKTTIAERLEQRLRAGSRVENLDADMVRTHICRGLGFTRDDRIENVRRLALLAGFIAETGAIVLVSAISPYRAARDEARSLLGAFLEVYVNAPLWICEGRDVKGLYRKARRGEIQAFTGIDDPYEPPLHADIECRTDLESIEESVEKVLAAVERHGERRLRASGFVGAGIQEG